MVSETVVMDAVQCGATVLCNPCLHCLSPWQEVNQSGLSTNTMENSSDSLTVSNLICQFVEWESYK